MLIDTVKVLYKLIISMKCFITIVNCPYRSYYTWITAVLYNLAKYDIIVI